MIILDPIFIHRTEDGLYAQRAEENLHELKRLVKDIIIKEREATNTSYSWPSASSTNDTPSSEDSTQTTPTGGKVRCWAKRTVIGRGTKKAGAVKTFSL